MSPLGGWLITTLGKTMTTKTYTEQEIEKMRSGQQMVIAAIVLNLGSMVFRFATPSPALGIITGIVGLVAICISIIGLLRLTGGLKYHIVGRILCCLLMFIPLVNIITLAIINSKATKILKDSGYDVGLFGAKKKDA
jgi:hypothetical protein